MIALYWRKKPYHKPKAMSVLDIFMAGIKYMDKSNLKGIRFILACSLSQQRHEGNGSWNELFTLSVTLSGVQKQREMSTPVSPFLIFIPTKPLTQGIILPTFKGRIPLKLT